MWVLFAQTLNPIVADGRNTPRSNQSPAESAGAAKKGGISPVTAVLDYTKPSTVPVEPTLHTRERRGTAQVVAGAAPFVDGYQKSNYPGREEEMFERLSKSQPIGRMAEPEEVASLSLFLCPDEASFITGVDYPLDGGFCNLRG